MRFLLLSLVVFAWAMPGLAAQTFTIPVTVVPNSVVGTVNGFPLPSSLPFSVPVNIVSGPCSVTGTFLGEIVNGGLELELDITAIGSGCGISLSFTLVFEMDVPELGGTVTLTRLGITPVVANFPVLQSVMSWVQSDTVRSTTSSLPGIVNLWLNSTTWKWEAGLSDYPEPPTTPQRLLSLIPGDTVRLPLRFSMSMSDSSPYVATLRMRYEFLTTVPEPSAALSLPIGALGLAGLAAMRGGS